jgi:hypothetical protein
MSSDLASPEPVTLGPREPVPERPFTSVDLIQRDLGILEFLLADVRALAVEAVEGRRQITPFETVSWEVDGLSHRHIVCREDRLRTHPGLCVVGFLGEHRTELDSTPLEEANTAVVGEFVRYPGITSYSSLALPGGQWANLVLHDDPVDIDYWRGSERHAQAVASLAPVHYVNVRIHNAVLDGPVLEEPTVVPKRVKYFDFSGDVEWRAVRELAT